LQSVANGQVDATLSAWLPNTHGPLLKKYKDDLTVVGTNLNGVKTGLVVPDYMSAKSISDLTTQAKQVITGIEPGAGIMASLKIQSRHIQTFQVGVTSFIQWRHGFST
jgi:glycine betaine/proline transport system substrate-binding protein